MSVPSAIVKEAKLRNIGALATTSKLLVASFFTVFSGSLFEGVYFSSTNIAQLRASSSFESPSIEFDATASLILVSNLSYPSYTYEDLAFPQFLPEMAFAEKDLSNTPSTNATVPELRSRLECRQYSASNIRVRVGKTNPDRNDTIEDYLNADVDGSNREYTGDIMISSNTTYFGAETGGYSDYTFVWGKLEPSAKSRVGHIAAMGCNQSAAIVDVGTMFIGADLAIDVDNPPRVVPNTERALAVPLNLTVFLYPSTEFAMPAISERPDLNKFFILLTQSRYAIPIPTLGGGNDDAVAAAIKFQHGIFFAQALNKGRVSATETNAMLTHEQVLAGENDAGRTL